MPIRRPLALCGAIAAFALSPDGRYLAFSTGDPFSGIQGATSKLWIRPIDSLEARPLPGTEGTSVLPDQFFWSPDSEFIGFVTQDGKLKKVSVNGGPPQTLSSVTPITCGSWGRDGTILLVRGPGPVGTASTAIEIEGREPAFRESVDRDV